MPAADFIQIACGCGKRLKALASSVGKRARCPACGATLIVAPVAARQPAVLATVPEIGMGVDAMRDPPTDLSRNSVSGPVSTEDVDDFYELARKAESAPVKEDLPRCPQCSSTMAAGAVLCTNCGYDSRTGKKVSIAAANKPAKSGASAKSGKGKGPVDRFAPAGSFVAGIALSLAFAVGASILWIGVALLSGVTIGYIAALIGVAAGLGMRTGLKGFTFAGGLTASLITLGVILLAKTMVIEVVIVGLGVHRSIFDLDSAKLAHYYFSPIGLVIIFAGVAAAYRTSK